MVERFEFYDDGFDNSSIINSVNGDMVLYSDYIKLLRACKRFTEAVVHIDFNYDDIKSEHLIEFESALTELEEIY